MPVLPDAARRRAHTFALVRVLRAHELKKSRKRTRRMPRQVPPLAVERAYGTEIGRYVDLVRAIIDRLLMPELPWILDEARRTREDDVRADAAGTRIREIFRRIANTAFDALSPVGLDRLAEAFADRTQAWNRKELKRQAEATIGVDVFANEPDLAALTADFVAENVALIRTVPTRYLEQTEGIVLRGVTSGALARDIGQQLQDATDVAKRRAQLIARDQIGKFYGQVNKARQAKVGVETYFWRDVGDNRVRPEHEERDGNEYAWTQEAAERLGVEYLPPEEQPGQPINCRCSAEPNVDRLLESL